MNYPNKAPKPEPVVDVLHYSDGFIGESYARPGDVVTLEGSVSIGGKKEGKVGLAHPLDSATESIAAGMAVVITESGRKLGLTAGLVIDMDKFEFEEPFLDRSYELTVGEQNPDIALLGEDRIKQVVIRSDKQSQQTEAKQADGPSNFHVLEEMAQHIIANNELPERKAAAERFEKLMQAGGGLNPR